ncbi:hypothetical protein B0J18DRAFT_394901 [Chaetomium sp. MPI-SDFR-AT-0129]|nr:hypothetical protein B0J18DRAFT_394901 [Chaetomium sp. MPI-SDFR-AT-0129]
MASTPSAGIIPAQLGFLAIYNPSLGTTDETVEDQLVYYASPSTLSASKRRRHRVIKDGRAAGDVSNAERNERLRQVGLAQGMAEFGRSFSGGKPVDSIDTERTRVVLHELEPGWWILASIDLTRLPLPPSKSTPSSPSSPLPPTSKGDTPPIPYEYSSRELKPPALLLQDLIRAHSLFLLHHRPAPETTNSTHGTPHSPLSTLLSASPSRAHFMSLLAAYWDAFLLTWSVLLHGNPACAVWGGIKMAASGELGMGVGEEDRGSGEREVLEALVESRETVEIGVGLPGLVDLVVGRFGEDAEGENTGGQGKGKEKSATVRNRSDERWVGLGSEVGDEDGMVFLGVGSLSRPSVRTLTWWMEDIYAWGETAFGVLDGVAGSGSRARRKRGDGKKTSIGKAPLVENAKKDSSKPTPKSTSPTETSGAPGTERRGSHPNTAAAAATQDAPAETEEAGGGMDKMLSYLKLGYGTYWSLGTSNPPADSDADNEAVPNLAGPEDTTAAPKPPLDPTGGYFLLGLGEDKGKEEQEDPSPQTNRIKPRTVTVELEVDGSSTTTSTIAQLRPVVYLHRPFIYILLFGPDTTTSTPWVDLAKILSTQLTPLHKPLLHSTAYRPEKPNHAGTGVPQQPSRRGSSSSSGGSELYDLVFDPQTLTIHSTIPNIPDPFIPAPHTTNPASILAPPPLVPHPSAAASAAWTRAEALSTHAQILSMAATTRHHDDGADGDDTAGMVELTCKTSRGWWVVWSRVAEEKRRGSTVDGDGNEDWDRDGDASGDGSLGAAGPVLAAGKEIFLIRRASDHHGPGGLRGVGSSYAGVGGGGVGVGGASGGWADGASRLAQGIGVDTRRYIEGLLSLNR